MHTIEFMYKCMTGTLNTEVYISLHTEEPIKCQTDNECNYPKFNRQEIKLTPDNWGVDKDGLFNKNSITFPGYTDFELVTDQTIMDEIYYFFKKNNPNVTHFSIGENESGKGDLLFTGSLTVPLTLMESITPEFDAGSVTIGTD